MDDIAGRVKKIIIQYLGIDENKIVDNSSFTDLGADSLESVEIVMAFEEEFGIDLLDKDAQDIKTIADAINRIKRMIAEKNQIAIS